MMNVRKHRKVELITEQRKLKRWIARPSFQSFRIFNDNIVGVEMKKERVRLFQPIYVGFSILDISKILMYDFHYGYIIPKYGSKARLLFTDTDSLTFELQTEDIYTDMATDIDLFNTSEYPIDHALYNITNKKVLGKMKDESFGVPFIEFVGLRPKMYSMISATSGKKTAKGIAKYVVKRSIKHEHYKECLFKQQIKSAEMNQIRSYEHQLYSIKLKKIGLSPYDDKRYILPNGNHTLAHGHCKIDNM